MLAGGEAISVSSWFAEAVGRLAPSDQKAAWATVFMVQAQGFTPGMRVHPVLGYLSITSSMSVRILAVRLRDSILLVYVDRHDSAYRWAETNLATRANDGCSIDIVTIRRSECLIARDAAPQYGARIAERLAGLDIPDEALTAISQTHSEADLLALVQNSSEELCTLVLRAVFGEDMGGATPYTGSSVRMVSNDRELREALRYPLERWRLFLHPRQQVAVAKPMAAKLLVNGGAGTGKTVVIVHRAVALRRRTSEIMILTKSRQFADHLRTMVSQMSGEDVMIGHLAIRHRKADAVLWGNRLIWKVPKKRANPISVSIATPEDEGYQKHGVTQLQHILIDEAHDFDGRELVWLEKLLTSGSLGLTIGFDQNQATNLEVALSFMDRIKALEREGAVEEVYLEYCYRMTRQIFDEAYQSRPEAILHSYSLKGIIPRNWRDRFSARRTESGVSVSDTPRTVFYGIEGSPVKTVDIRRERGSSQEEVLKKISAAVDDALAELLVDYPAKDLAVIYCSMQLFKKNALSDDHGGGLRLQTPGVRVQWSKLTRSLEWFAGVVVVDMGATDENERFAGHSIESLALGSALRYVAMSRFRERLIVIRAM